MLEETEYFNASLYTPFGIAGVETLGYEIAEQSMKQFGKYPDAVVITHAGGGNLTGTARGLKKVGATDTKIIGASVDLHGLHMASDNDFNKKSFTTGHTGFGIPFATFPDRSDVPRNAARPLRYMDEYVLVTQGEVFYITEMLANIEGMQRGPAGNTSLAAAFALAMEMNEDQIIVVNETEYTGAGKLPSAQLTFAKENGIEIKFGDPIKEDIPGKNIVLPDHPSKIGVIKYPLEKLRKSYIKELKKRYGKTEYTEKEKEFIAEDLRITKEEVEKLIKEVML
nr:PLP-dependent lyase/thiolase [Marinitoga lauensis]